MAKISTLVTPSRLRHPGSLNECPCNFQNATPSSNGTQHSGRRKRSQPLPLFLKRSRLDSVIRMGSFGLCKHRHLSLNSDANICVSDEQSPPKHRIVSLSSSKCKDDLSSEENDRASRCTTQGCDICQDPTYGCKSLVATQGQDLAIQGYPCKLNDLRAWFEAFHPLRLP